MRNNVRYLSEIKTNADRRRRKEVHEEIGNLKEIAVVNEVDAYCVVMWDEGGAHAYWNTEALGPLADLRAELVKRVIERVEANHDTKEVIEDMVEE